MNHKNTRRPYAAPEAEIICLAPQENISSWQPWFQQDDKWWALNQWGAPVPIDVSITGGYTWLDVYDENGQLVGNSEIDN